MILQLGEVSEKLYFVAEGEVGVFVKTESSYANILEQIAPSGLRKATLLKFSQPKKSVMGDDL